MQSPVSPFHSCSLPSGPQFKSIVIGYRIIMELTENDKRQGRSEKFSFGGKLTVPWTPVHHAWRAVKSLQLGIVLGL